jgi:hypothetical protein
MKTLSHHLPYIRSYLIRAKAPELHPSQLTMTSHWKSIHKLETRHTTYCCEPSSPHQSTKTPNLPHHQAAIVHNSTILYGLDLCLLGDRTTCTTPYNSSSWLNFSPDLLLSAVLLTTYHDQTEIHKFDPYSTSLTRLYSRYNLLVVMQLA